MAVTALLRLMGYGTCKYLAHNTRAQRTESARALRVVLALVGCIFAARLWPPASIDSLLIITVQISFFVCYLVQEFFKPA